VTITAAIFLAIFTCSLLASWARAVGAYLESTT
jgi:hypothetical protein